MGKRISRKVRWAGLGVLASFLVVVGCAQSGPKYYPVVGKLVMENDGSVPKKLIRQTIEFQSATEPNTRAFGEIKPDGSFELSTWREGKGTLGVIEGSHKGRMLIDIPQEETASGKKRKGPIDFKYTRFETCPWTITVPPTEEVILKVPVEQ
jgi:hypothetical protein